uniref:Uncharacterized protein n=1 Tax=Oryza barthii TaxID=65489 RepID=A0A0D3G3C6_9ORYZ
MISQLFFPHRFLRSRHVSFLDSNSLCLCVAAASSQSNLVNCIFIEFFLSHGMEQAALWQFILVCNGIDLSF